MIALMLYFSHMFIIALLVLLLGLGLFIFAGIRMNDNPGVETRHLVIMLLGLVLLVGGFFGLYSALSTMT